MVKIALEQIRIASPCTVAWDDMDGDDRTRFCQQCELSVHNISDMSQADAESFLTEATGRVCIRMYQRSDGTILTQDCPVGLRAVRVRLGQMLSAAIALLGVFICSVSFAAFGTSGKEKAAKTIDSLIKMAQPELPQDFEAMMGDVCIQPQPILAPAPTPIVTNPPLPSTGDVQ